MTGTSAAWDATLRRHAVLVVLLVIVFAAVFRLPGLSYPAEEYFEGRLYVNPVERFGPVVLFDRDRHHQLASVTKSITSILTGLAIENGFVAGVDAPVHTFFPEYDAAFDEQERRITVEHLLTMTSGWEWNARMMSSSPKPSGRLWARVVWQKAMNAFTSEAASPSNTPRVTKVA